MLNFIGRALRMEKKMSQTSFLPRHVSALLVNIHFARLKFIQLLADRCLEEEKEPWHQDN